MSRSNDDDFILFAILLLSAAITLFVWWFSQKIGVDMPSALSIIARTIITAGLAWAANKYLNIAFKYLLPTTLACLIASWYPAVDYWASQSFQSGLGYFTEDGIKEQIWWASWWAKSLLFVGIVSIGHGLIWLLDNR